MNKPGNAQSLLLPLYSGVISGRLRRLTTWDAKDQIEVCVQVISPDHSTKVLVSKVLAFIYLNFCPTTQVANV